MVWLVFDDVDSVAVGFVVGDLGGVFPVDGGSNNLRRPWESCSKETRAARKADLSTAQFEGQFWGSSDYDRARTRESLALVAFPRLMEGGQKFFEVISAITSRVVLLTSLEKAWLVCRNFSSWKATTTVSRVTAFVAEEATVACQA